MKKFIGKIIFALLIFALILCGGIYLIAELTWFHGTLINPNGNVTVDSDNHFNPPIFPRTVNIVYEDVVPENVADRGLILMGSDYEAPFRASYDSRHSTSERGYWFDEYICDCNLNVESTDEEFHEFCDRFSEFGEVSFNDYGNGEICHLSIPNYNLPDTHYASIDIYRSCLLNEDLSTGYIMYDGDPGYGLPVYYDPTGKYVFEISGAALKDEYYLAFIEPEMVSVDFWFSLSEPIYFEDDETVQLFVDAIHELRLKKVDIDITPHAMAEIFIGLSFTDVNGYTNHYKIVGQYLLHGYDAYYIENPDALQFLEEYIATPPEVEDSSELSENDEG